LRGPAGEPRRKWIRETWETLDISNGNGEHA
jgi:hypothetical protein